MSLTHDIDLRYLLNRNKSNSSKIEEEKNLRYSNETEYLTQNLIDISGELLKYKNDILKSFKNKFNELLDNNKLKSSNKSDLLFLNYLDSAIKDIKLKSVKKHLKSELKDYTNNYDLSKNIIEDISFQQNKIDEFFFKKDEPKIIGLKDCVTKIKKEKKKILPQKII